MKKVLNILFVMFLLSGTLLFAANEMKVEVSVNDRALNAGQGHGGSVTDDLYDLQFNFPCAVATGEAGVETDGNYIYTTEWNGAAGFFRYELDGTYVGTFSVAGAGNVRDLAYDGQYFYGAAASTSLFEMDFTPGAETLISTINAPVACRAIAYDPVNDGFWANNWSDAITLFDRSGSTLDSFVVGAMESFYGFAWEDVLPGGPYLWGASQSGNGNDLVKMDLANGGAQIEVYDIANSGITYAAGVDICGGLYISDALVAGKWTIGGIIQNTSIWGLELADSAPLDAPGAPTGVTVVPDAGGALEADIDWICPDVQVNGDPLTELTEMEVYRDDVLIYTDSSPTIGGAGSYTDAAVPSSAIYAYKVLGVNSAGEGLPVVISTWVGEDVPNMVTDLLLEQTNPGVLSGTLTWVNPMTGLNGGAFNEAILGYHIERNDGEMFEVTGEVTEYIDNTILIAGNYFYTVQPYNSIGDGGVETSNIVLIADAGLLIMEDFATWLPADWTTEGGANWMSGATNLAGGTAPEAHFNWSPSATATQRLISPVVNTTGATELNLSFMHLINDYNGDYVLSIQTTSDGTTWNDVMIIPSVNVGPELIEEVFTTSDVGSDTFQIAWVFAGNSFNINHWYVDDVMLTYTPEPVDPGWIEGLVVISDGAGDVEDVVVSAGGYTTNPLTDGTYSIELQPGTYDVTATLAGYDTEVIEDVVVEEAISTTGIDFNLMTGVGNDIIAATKLNSNYPNPFNPITHIAYSIRESGNVTLEVYNLKGQLVKSLLNEVKETGDYTILWNGTDNSNKSVSSGVYFYKMKTQNYNSTKKMILMK